MSIDNLRQKYIRYITWVDQYLHSASSVMNDQSLNVHIEYTIIRILNLTYGYNLVNANIETSNVKAIDAFDKEKMISFQITSNISFSKVFNTINKYVSDEMYSNYGQLNFFYIRLKKKLNENQLDKIDQIGNGKLKFTNENLLDFKDALNKLSEDYDKLERAINILEKELPQIVKIGSKKKKFNMGISLSFRPSNEELNLIIQICELFADSNFHIYTNNKKVVGLLVSDDVFYVKSKSTLPELNLCIIFLANTLQDKELSDCFILNRGLEGQTTLQNISFDPIDNFNSDIIDTKCYKYVNGNNLYSKINRLIISNLKQLTSKELESQESIAELIEIYADFEHKLLNKSENSKKFYTYHQFKDYDDQKKFLILSKKIPTFEKAHIEFRREFPDDKNFILLIHKNSRHKTDRRISILKKLFGIKYCEYISDKIGKTVKKKFKQNPLLKSKIFIEPILTDKSLPGKANAGIGELQDWFNEENNPLLFLIGQGGIGKTTLCQHLHDKLLNDDQIVLYINAYDLVSELNDSSFSIGNEAYDIYNFYIKWFPKTETHQTLLSRTAFYGNLSNGNIKIIFDGLDEIISSKPNFNLASFVNYLGELIEVSHLAKIIISIRDYQYKLLVRDTKLNHHIGSNYETFEVELFTNEMAKKYFNKKFEHTPSVNEECFKIISNIIKDNGKEFKYPPYLLFLISKIVVDDISQLRNHEIDKIIDSKNILDKILIEYLQREFGKKSFINLGIEIQDQLKIMLDLAFHTKEGFSKKEADRIIKRIKEDYFSEEFFRKLVDHPYFIFDEARQTFDFQFEFLKDHLRSIKLSHLINDDSSNGEIVIQFIADYLKPQTVLFKLLLDRISETPVINFIKNLSNLRQDGMDSSDIREAISNLFQLCLEKVGKNKPAQIYTKILIKIFEREKKSGIIDGVVFKDCPHGHGITFDFSNLIISNSIFSNFSRFFECNFNRETLFIEDCTLTQLQEPKISPEYMQAKMINFSENILGDKSYLDVLLKKDQSYSVLNNASIKSFKRVLSSLIKSSKYINQGILQKAYLADRKFDVTIFNLTLKVLTKNKVLLQDARSYRIYHNEIENISMFLENTFISKNMAKAIREFKSELS